MPNLRKMSKKYINVVDANEIPESNQVSPTADDIKTILDVPIDKRTAKRDAKSTVSTKFIVGHIYKLMDTKRNKFFIPRIFKCVKFIYSIKNIPVNIVIMKAIDNKVSQKFSLNQTECYKFHIKYEPGLEVYSMTLNWKDITKIYNK